MNSKQVQSFFVSDGKDSIKTTLFRCVFIDSEGRQDYNIIRLAKSQSKLMLNTAFLNHKYMPKWFETPFTGIRISNLSECINPEYNYILEKDYLESKDMDLFLAQIISDIKKYLVENIKPDRPYLHLHSGGYDSRIISACLRDLWNEGMRFSIHFRCHQPEGPMFYEIMKREGWDKSFYSVYPGRAENYYDIGHAKDPLNGWQNYNQTMNFWSDIVKTESEVTLITGVDGEMFKHIAQSYNNSCPQRCGNKKMNVFLEGIYGEGLWDCIYLKKFRDVLTPYFGYYYLKTALSVSPSWCKWLGNTDSIRFNLAKTFSYDISEVPYGIHDYSWNLTDKFYESLNNQFSASRFYKDFGKMLSKKPDFNNMYGWDAKLWGFMTTYDAIYE
jgi:hypothetical protein